MHQSLHRRVESWGGERGSSWLWPPLGDGGVGRREKKWWFEVVEAEDNGLLSGGGGGGGSRRERERYLSGGRVEGSSDGLLKIGDTSVVVSGGHTCIQNTIAVV